MAELCEQQGMLYAAGSSVCTCVIGRVGALLVLEGGSPRAALPHEDGQLQARRGRSKGKVSRLHGTQLRIGMMCTMQLRRPSCLVTW